VGVSVPDPIRRQRRRVLTDKMVAVLPRKRRRYIVTDPEQRGMYVRVSPQGPAVFAAVARDPYGKQVWATLGTADVLKIENAREKAREAIRRIKEGKPAFEPRPVQPDSFQAVAENWLRRHVQAKGLRTQAEVERELRVYVFPHWAARPFTSLRRSDVAALLDHVEDHHGSRMADVVLGVVRSIGNWYGSRSDDYLSPFLRHARRDQGGKRARILSDDELRAVWQAAEDAGSFGAFIKLLLLTAQRRGAVACMRWSNISPDGVWHMPRAEREKGNAGALRLPVLAMKAINAQPRLASNSYVFAGRDTAPMGRFTHRHVVFKAQSGTTGWTLHDLRRTARSLMSRAGVISDHAERVMGHVIAGVEGVYDHHHYLDEKGNALAKLAALIETIVRGEPCANVVPLRTGAVRP
jgi:integrase